jgi:bacillolysin
MIKYLTILILIAFSLFAYSQDRNSKNVFKKVESIQLNEPVTIISNQRLPIHYPQSDFKIPVSKKKTFFKEDTTIILSRNPISGLPNFLKKNSGIPTRAFGAENPSRFSEQQIEDIGLNVLEEISYTLQIEEPKKQFSYQDRTIDNKGNVHIKMRQHLSGVPIYGGDLIIHFNTEQHNILVTGNYYKIEFHNKTPLFISENQVLNVIENDLIIRNKLKLPQSVLLNMNLVPIVEKVILPTEDLKSGTHAFHVIYWVSPISRWEYFIDATKGAIIKSFENQCNADGPVVSNGKDLNGINRTFGTTLKLGTYYMQDISKPMYNSVTGKGLIKTYDMKNDTSGTIYTAVSKDNTWDPKAVSAHYNASFCYDYYKKNHGRNSIDNKGMDIISIINVPDFETGKSLENAFWNGKAMFYGNGGKVFKPLSGSIDVAGHEMTHGVIQFSANLEYEAQPGAINESMADIFGFMVDTTDWLIGEDIILDKINYPTGALRSLSDPHNGGKSLSDDSFQPRNMSEYYSGSADNYGVHINSGIPNYAFYLIASNPSVGKIKAAKIYYHALTNYLVKLSQFLDLRLALIQSAKDLYGSSEADVVEKAFDAVGIVDANAIQKVSDLKINPGTEYLLTYNTSKTDTVGIYRRSSLGASPKALSNKTVRSRPSVTDDGKTAFFIGTDYKMYTLSVDPGVIPDKTVIQSQPIWSNVAISKDGKRIAAITKSQDTSIYIYDFGIKKWFRYMLYAPTFTNGLKAPGPIYADAIDWDYTGQNLVYDCYNKVKDESGNNILYWDINIINVWNTATNSSTDGKITKLFSLSEGDNIGNPTFSKNSPQKIAFDYFNDQENIYSIIGYDIEKNEVDLIADNNTIGFPSYDKIDSRIAFATDSMGVDIIKYVNINNDKISSTDTPKRIVSNAKWPVFYSVGKRNSVIPPTPNITTDRATEICIGQSVNLSSSSLNGNQWYKNGIKIPNAVSKTYQASESGSYCVVVTQDSVSSAPSSAITVVSYSIPSKPVLTGGMNICNGDSVVLVSSSTTLENMWYLDGILIKDSTRSRLVVKKGGSYTIKANNNGCMSALSDSTKIVANAIPLKPAVSGGMILCSGTNVTLSSSSSSGNQWLLGGVAIKDSTRDKLVVSAAGSFSVRVTLNNCTGPVSDVFAVTAVTTPSKPTISRDASGNLVASINIGNQWYKDTTAIPGAKNETFKPTEAGYYNVRTTIYGCTSPASESYYYLVSALNDITFRDLLKFYPNPSKGYINMVYNALYKEIYITILDMNGKSIINHKKFRSGNKINITGVANGNYIILARDSKGILFATQILVKD